MKRTVLCALLVSLLALGVAAREKKKPSELYAEKEKAFRRAVAAKYVEVAKEAKKVKLYRFCREMFEEALVYDTNERTARKELGYVRRGSGWTLDPSEAKKLPEQNTRPTNMFESDFKKLVKEWEGKKERAERWVAAKYAGLGKWCDKMGLHDQAIKAWEKSLKLDTDNETARAGLGYRKVDGEWLTDKQIQARKEAKEGKLVNDTPSRYEAGLGVKLNKMESGHFRIETVFPPETLREYIKNCETTYAYFLRDVGEPEIRDIWGKKAFIIVLGSVEQWHRYVDMRGGSERQRNFTKKLQGTRSDESLEGAQVETENSATIDGLVHKTAHFLAWHYWRIPHAWLQEGFAYYYTVKVLESTRTHCTALGTYDHMSDGEKKWGESENWKELIKKEVLDHADPDVRMFHRTPISDLQYNASVKAWSMISWLFDKHREKFMKWLNAVGKGGRKQEEALKEIFGWSFEELDKEWREYVKESY